MRIAQIAPLHEAVPPKLYGGTERVVSHLTEELVALGHQVTLFASGDSVTSARLHAVCPRSLRLELDRLLRVIPDRHCAPFGILDRGLVTPEDDHCIVTLELIGPTEIAE